GVAHREHDDLSHVGGLNDDTAAIRHRVARVDHQVHDHLADLVRVHADARYAGRESGRELDVVAEYRLEHTRHVGDQLVQVHGRRRRWRLPAPGQNLLGERGTPLGGALDRLRIAPHWIVRPQAPQHQLGVAADDREQVVEVVSDAAGVSPQSRVVGQRLLEAGSAGPGDYA